MNRWWCRHDTVPLIHKVFLYNTAIFQIQSNDRMFTSSSAAPAGFEALIDQSLLAEFQINAPDEAIRHQEYVELQSLGHVRPGFDLDVYLSLLPLTKAAAKNEVNSDNENDRLQTARTHAAKLALLFGNRNSAISYLRRSCKYTEKSRKPIHDACLFTFPLDPAWDISQHWRGIVNNRKNQPTTASDLILQILNRAHEIDKYYYQLREKIKHEISTKVRNNLKNSAREEKSIIAIIEKVVNTELPPLSANTPLSELNGYLSHLTYPRAEENPEAAKLFNEYKQSNQTFERYLGLIPKDDDTAIPPITIDGCDIAPEYKDYELKKISSYDCRAGLLGRMTSCCQSLDDIGNDCVIDGITNPDSGFYILVKKATKVSPEKIVAQSWARRCNSKILLDSVESQSAFEDRYATVVNDFIMLLAHKLVTEHGIEQVLIGNDGATPEKILLISSQVQAKSAYRSYSDAKDSQSIIADMNAQAAILSLYRKRNPDTRLPQGETIANHNLEYLLHLIWGNPKNSYQIFDKILDDKSRLFLANKLKAYEEWNLFFYEHINIDTDNDAIIEKMKILIQRGANINMLKRSDIGNCEILNALTYFCEQGLAKVVRYLVDNGADIKIVNNDGLTALQVACEKGNPEVIKILIKNGADTNILTRDGSNIFDLACNKGNAETAKFLFEAVGFDVNRPDYCGRYLLHHACANRHTALVKLLLEFGANVNSKTRMGTTALDIARDKKYEDIIQLLVKPTVRLSQNPNGLLSRQRPGNLNDSLTHEVKSSDSSLKK